MGLFGRIFGRKPADPKPLGKRGYEGAANNRLTADWLAGSRSADAEILGSLRTLRDRSRQIIRDYDFVRHGLSSIVNNVVGKGVKLQMQVPKLRGKKLDEKINDAIEMEFWRWGRRGRCDVTGIHSWEDLQRIVLRSVAQDGEILVRAITSAGAFGDSNYPFALEIIEADFLDENKNGPHNGNEIRMGVEVDRWGRPVAYWFRNRHPGDYAYSGIASAETGTRVPASEIRHVFLPDRPHQTRGVPWLACALSRVRQVKGYEESEVVAARAQAANMGVIETEGDYATDGEQDGMPVINMAPGVIERLAPGEKITWNNPTRPAGNYEPFMRAQMRGIAAGLSITYEELTGDYSQSNYSSSRMAMLNSRDHYRVIQDWLIGQLHEWVFAKWIETIDRWKVLDNVGFAAKAVRYEDYATWRPRGWSWIDPSKEVQSAKESIRAGFMTMRDVAEAQGLDLEELMAARRAELDMAETLGLDFDTDPGAFTLQGQAQQANVAGQVGQPDNPKADQSAGGQSDGSQAGDSAADS